MLNIKSEQIFCKTNIIFSSLSLDEWRRLASYIDNGFLYSSEKSFSVERKNGYYYLNTNTCDDVSIIRVYCEIDSEGINKIERLGDDTDGWYEIHPSTYKRIEKILNELQS